MTTANAEILGPVETLIQTLLPYADHMVHNRPGVVTNDPGSVLGVRWEQVTHKVEEDGTCTVFLETKQGKKRARTEIGKMNGSPAIRVGARVIGTYQPAGIFPMAAAWIYRQIAEVWRRDNEIAARWASFAFGEEHRDLKVALAAFMLVQSRKGDPVLEAGERIFDDDDFRDVGEAMLLLQKKDRDFNPKMLMRIWELLSLPQIIAINTELGFGRSAKHAFLGRWPVVVEKWLRYREQNPRMLEGLVKGGFRKTVMRLAQKVRYKPDSDRFFEILRWKQEQADDGRREIAIGKAVKAAESWEKLSEKQICNRIEKDKPNWKRIVGLLPKSVGVTRAIVAAAIDAGSLSDKDLIILTPTLEELGLLKIQAIKTRLDYAISTAEDMRAANIARNVRSTALKEKLVAGGEKVAQKAVAEVLKAMRLYFFIDRSGSMQRSIELAKAALANIV